MQEQYLKIVVYETDRLYKLTQSMLCLLYTSIKLINPKRIWEPNSLGIDEFDALDYIDVVGDVTSFQGNLQVDVYKRQRYVCSKTYEREFLSWYSFGDFGL